MTLLNMLDALENTLDSVEVKGYDNMDKIMGCVNVVRQMKGILEEMQQKQDQQGDEVDGRQTDIGIARSDIDTE